MLSGLFGGGGDSEAQAAQQAELAKARAALQQYRPEAMQARLNLFNNASTAYQGANNALETMYGGGGNVGGGGGESPRRLMGHDLPADAGGGGSAPMPPGQQGPPPRQHIGDGNRWEDTAARFIDPAGFLRGLF
jgi:hypothetical protein